VLPGYRTTDRSTVPLRRWLRYLGYRTYGWGQGRNEGRVQGVLPALVDRMNHIGADPVALVGWSWGGVVARALARQVPDRVSQVITLGTPIHGGVGGTVFGQRVAPDLLRQSRDAAAEREREPMPVPALSIYTEHDGVVAWRASLDPKEGQTEHLKVDSSHLGLGLSPAVWLAVAERLSP